MVVNSEWAQVEAIELENDGSGLAFGIIGGRSTGVVVKTILPGGVADRDGRLQSGDHILRIGEVSMRGLGCEQAAAVLRQCGVRVRLLVARTTDPSAEFRSLGASNAPIVPTKVLGDPDELDRALLEAGYTEGLPSPSPAPLVDRYEDRYVYHRGGVDLELLPISVVDVVRSGAPLPPLAPPVRKPPPPAQETPPPPLLPLDAALRGGPAAPEVESFSVTLSKDVYGLGITVAGYVCEEEDLSGIFVKSISTGSSADLCNKIQINDRIVEVDGQPLQSVSNHQAVELLRCTGSTVRLKLERFLRGPRYEKLQKALKVQGVGAGPPSPSVSSLPACPVTMYEESSVIEPELESRATIDYPPPCSPVSCGAPDISSPSEDKEIVIGREPKNDGALRAIQDKWREILSLEPDGDVEDLDIVVGRMMKEPGGGLGISLEGTVEVRGGREVRPHHYIRSILQDGPLGRSGQLRAGDELLEVNGRRLLGLHHLEVVRALKQLPASVCLVCARRPGRRNLIDTAQHRAAFAARNILGGSLQNLLPPPERMIKAKSESSIASACSTNATFASTILGNPSLKSRSRSLEPMSGLAMWSDQPEYIELIKGDRGLGFSILDYQDPVEPKSTVIVVRSVVPGGAASRNGKLRPGDRLISVNGTALGGASLAQAVQVLKSAPKGIVKIGVAKPLPTSSFGNSTKKNNDSIGSQDGVNSAGSDDHTGFDSYHECLQEYQECLEVVQICLEPEDSSLRDDMSNLEDFSFEEMKNDSTNGHNKNGTHKNKNGEKKNDVSSEFYNVKDLISDNLKYNGSRCDKCDDLQKSDDSLDGHDEDMTITEDDPEKYTNGHDNIAKVTQNGKVHDINKSDPTAIRRRSLTSGHNRDLSTSDEMVFAVTPTGLERISYEKYWRDIDLEESSKDSEKIVNLDSVKSDESWKDCNSVIVSPHEMTQDIINALKSKRSAFENSLQFIDHDIEGYDTCLDDDSSSIKADDTLVNNNTEVILSDGSDKVNRTNEKIFKLDSQKNIKDTTAQNIDSISVNQDNKKDVNMLKNKINEADNYVVKKDIKNVDNEKFILNNNINNNTEVKTDDETTKDTKEAQRGKLKKKIHRIKVVEYYNDQAECLEEYLRQKQIEDEKKKQLQEQKKELVKSKPDAKIVKQSRSLAFRESFDRLSEDSSDKEMPSLVPGCHKCYLEHYLYGISKAISDAKNCKFCAAVRSILEPPKKIPKRSRSSPAIMDPSRKKKRTSKVQTTMLLSVPQGQDRRRSAGPLYFYPDEKSHHLHVERQAYTNIPIMTVSLDKYASPEHGASVMEKHWGKPRKVVIARIPNSSIGISIVGGKVDITNTSSTDSGDDSVVISGIFIKNVVANSPAGQCGELRTGDRILEVDGIDVRTASHEKAVQIIRAAGDSVTFLVQSLIPWSTDPNAIDNQKPEVNTSTAADTVSESPSQTHEQAPSNTQIKTLALVKNILIPKGEDVVKNETIPQHPTTKSSPIKTIQDLSIKSEPQPSIKTLALINKVMITPDEKIEKVAKVKSETKIATVTPVNSALDAELVTNEPSVKSDINSVESVDSLRETTVEICSVEPFIINLGSPKPKPKLNLGSPIPKPRNLSSTPPPLPSSPKKTAKTVPSPIQSPDKEVPTALQKINTYIEVNEPGAPPLPEKPKSRPGTPGSLMVVKEPMFIPPPSPLKVASPAKVRVDGVVPGSPVKTVPTPTTSSKPLPPSPPPEKAKVVYSDDEDSDEDDDEEDRRDLEGRTYTAKGVEIDRASAGAVKRSKEEKEADPEDEDNFGYTTNKVKKKYSYLGESVVCVQLERGVNGLGISLAGHRDRSRMAVFVCGLRPGGAASKGGGVRIGDEILEVNGVVLHGRCHLNASAIIKGLAGPIFKVILLRRSKALEDVAVKPLTQFPVTLEDESDESRYAAYKNVRTVTIKKGTQSLGIMIIEGRHAEVGQGIFISDIQQGSAAEQAGLIIGDMILAVNKDTLLGSNYDTAASMLKKTEGIVVLLVCNPNKKVDDGSGDAADVSKSQTPAKSLTPARSQTPAKGQTPARTPTPGGLKEPPHISRPNTPAGKMSLASPSKEPIADPATAEIVPGREILIEITTESKPLGIYVIGGQDSPVPGGVVIVEVYPDGKAAKDGRLKPGDQILECNGVKIAPEMSTEKILATIKQNLPKIKMLVLRSESVKYEEIEVDLIKKPGKGIGVGVMARKPPPGSYISELIPGGTAELDGRLQKGDVILAVNGQCVKETTAEDTAILLKCAQAKVTLKVGRHKLVFH